MKNPLQDWINTDKKLRDLLTEIESTGKSSKEQAEIAFDMLSDVYKIPKMPNDIPENEDDSEETIETISLFEEHALIKFLADENDDPRGFLLSAAFHLLNGYRVDIYEVAKKEFGNELPKNCRIGIKGSGYDGEVVFPQKEEENWIELGCKIMRQLI